MNEKIQQLTELAWQLHDMLASVEEELVTKEENEDLQELMADSASMLREFIREMGVLVRGDDE